MGRREALHYFPPLKSSLLSFSCQRNSCKTRYIHNPIVDIITLCVSEQSHTNKTSPFDIKLIRIMITMR